jgi:CheY-like chemotaxis protein
LPIIALTAYVLRANREAIFQAGADEIISKPVTTTEQIAIPLARALNISVSGAGPDNMGLRAPEETQLKALLEVVGSEDAEELLSRLRNDLAALRNELRQAIRDHDMAKIAEQMHVLVSIAGSVGASHLQGLAEELYAVAERMDWIDAATLAPRVDRGLTELMASVATEYRDRFGVT